jgi:hypothetical protein
MSTVYQPAEDVKQYVEMKVSSGAVNSMNIKAQKEKLIAQYIKRSEQYEEIHDYC